MNALVWILKDIKRKADIYAMKQRYPLNLYTIIHELLSIFYLPQMDVMEHGGR